MVPPGIEPTRLDRYAFQVLGRLASVSQAHKAARRGDLVLNGEPCEPSRWVRPGDRIVLLRGGRAPPRPYRLDVSVALEDDHLAVVIKPPGIQVSGPRHRTLENALPPNLTASRAEDALPWPRPVHRLDGRTGGLLIIAKSARARVELGRAFEERRVHKRYRALAVGRLEGEGTVEQAIDGREARTRFRAAGHARSLTSHWLTTVDLWPNSGRTHQLRRHLEYLGYPVLGDDLYGIEGMVLRGHGLFLRALELGFDHPVSGEPVHVEIPEPRKYDSHRRREQRRWERWADGSGDGGS